MIFYYFFFIINVYFMCDGAADYMETKAAFLKTCELKDPKFLACATETNKLLYKQLAKGIEGLEDIQLDPMKLKTVRILGDDGPVSLNTTISKGKAIGFSKIIVVEADVSPIDYSWTTKLHLSKLRIEGNYRMQGRVLVLPIVGSGKCWFEASGLDLIAYTKTHLYEKFGHMFFNITAIKVDFKISGLKLHLDNLFDGVKILDDSTNEYLNENWRPVSESLKPILSKTIEDNFFVTMNRIFAYIPAEYFISDLKHPSELYGNS